MKTIFFTLIILLITQKTFELRCSLIFDKEECNINDECMFSIIVTSANLYPGVEKTIRKCFEKKFILASIKAEVFHSDFFSRKDKELVEKAGLSAMNLENPKNIEKLVQTLITKKEISFFEKFLYDNEEADQKEQEE